MTDLYRRSIEIILAHQDPSGAYVASPNFVTYRFCWFRDGAYTAYAMDLAGEHESSRRFHQWAAERINARAEVVRSGLAKWAAGQKLSDGDILHTRYRLDGGDAADSGWGNFQLDGFGTWLWSLNEFRKLNPETALPPNILAAAGLVADYLGGLWNAPCYDCWEEFPEHLHPHTWAAIYGGLCAHQELTGRDHQAVTASIRENLLQAAAEFGHFVKFRSSSAVDASLLGLSVPYAVVPPDDARMLKTVEAMEKSILRGGGLHRYATDSYYGGGAWILLSAWLGWYYAELVQLRPDLRPALKVKIDILRAWIEAHAGSSGELPEQVAEDLNEPSYYPTWVERWGPVASPLLWSHASYIILAHSFGPK